MQIFRLSLFLLLLLPFALKAQQTEEPRPVCGAHEAEEALLNADPALKAQHELWEAELEAQTNALLKQWATQTNKTNEAYQRTKYIIPVVIHVVHGNNTPISVADVETQFPVLFHDFRRLPGSPAMGGRGTDTQIEFSLATIDPDGNPTTGVVYHNKPEWASLNGSGSSVDGTMKNATKWPNTRYMNVWVVDKINGGVLGYAYKPNTNNAGDGVVIDKGTFGNRGLNYGFAWRYGRTATHEFGHWLSLDHPFNPNDQTNTGDCGGSSISGGDRISDTPPTAQPNFGKGNSRNNSCSNDVPDLPDNQRNFMDYLDDEAMNFFTPRQKARMHSALTNPANTQRFPLWQTTNLQKTGAGPYKKPRAQFVADNLLPCVGSPVQFYDFSMGLPNNFQWSFPGGSPETSTDASPVVTYAGAGSYDVQLIVKNLSGQLDTIYKTGYINVTADVKTLPIAEKFDGSVWDGWAIINPDTGWFKTNQVNPYSRKWEYKTDVNAEEGEGGSVYMNYFSYAEYGQIDELLSPPFDLTSETLASVHFQVAYAPSYQFAGNPIYYHDSLKVLASDDCGATWQTLYYKGGFDLMTRDTLEEPIGSSAFVPNPWEWRTDSISLSQFLGKSNVRIKFQGISGWGNNLYLDGINIDRIYVTDRQNVLPDFVQDLRIAPNPTNGQTSVSFQNSAAVTVNFAVYDLMGRQVTPASAQKLPAGASRFNVDVAQLPVGVYVLKMDLNGKAVSRKIVKY